LCTTELKIFPDLASLSLAAGQEIVSAVRGGRRFGLALSGGRTPRLLYELLGTRFAPQIHWPKLHVFFADERGVPPGHPHSNWRLAWEAFLGRVPLPPGNLHRIRGELPPLEAARRYEEELRRFGRLDLVLLGLGEDGHVASLFPGAPALQARGLVAAVPWPVGDPPLPRITLTLTAINAARGVFFLVAGAEKRGAVARAWAGEEGLPATRVAPRERLVWFLTQDAVPPSLRGAEV
jgi:6-phosphogluconolactonase